MLVLNFQFALPGVTRGFGDHDLRAQSSTSNPVYIKPFLTPQPEVRVLDVETEDITDSDVLVMATDGLWDVMANERVADIVNNGLTSKALTAGGGSGSGSAAKKKVINFSDDEMDQEVSDQKELFLLMGYSVIETFYPLLN